VIESIVSAINRHANSLLFIEISLLVLLLVLFVGTWIYNKKKYQNLKHQIPADVVKSYLDSIIHNSAALKSSLFRGGGGDVDPNQIPSILPISDLAGGGSIGIAGGTVSSEELNAKVAEIAKLRAEIASKNNQVIGLEKKVAQVQTDLDAALAKIAELEKLLAAGGAGGGPAGDAALQEQLTKTIAERDELKERLKEYAIIEDDLAELKRFKQENALLRKALEDAGTAIPEMDHDAAPVAEEIAPGPVVEEVPEPVVEEVAPEPVAEEVAPEAEEVAPEAEEVAPEAEEVAPEAEAEPTAEEVGPEPELPAAPVEEDPFDAAVAVAEDGPDDTSSDDDGRSPEDLLSEFEKMLG
jgi:hypothetical protein